MYLNVPINIQYHPVIKDTECMNAYLALYSTCLAPEKDKYIPLGWRGSLHRNEAFAAKSYLADILHVTESAVQSYLRRLKNSGLITIRKDEQTGRNIISVPAILASSQEATYIRLELPRNPMDYFAQKTRNIFKVYLHAALMAARQSYQTSIHFADIVKGEFFSCLSSIARHAGSTIQEVRTALSKLQAWNGVELKGLQSIGLKIKLLLYSDVRENKKSNPSDFTSSSKNRPSHSSDPVEKAVHHLYYDLKKNKDEKTYATLLSAIREGIPQDFPLEKLGCLLEEYYKKRGQEKLDAAEIVKYINAWHALRQAATRRQQEIEDKKEKVSSCYNKISKMWDKAQTAYDRFMKDGKFPSDTNPVTLHKFLFSDARTHEYLPHIPDISSQNSHENLKALFKLVQDGFFTAGKDGAFKDCATVLSALDNTAPDKHPRILFPTATTLYEMVRQDMAALNSKFVNVCMDLRAVSLHEYLNSATEGELILVADNQYVYDEWIKNKDTLTPLFRKHFGEGIKVTIRKKKKL